MSQEIMEAIQATIKGIPSFNNYSVVINDWDVLDESFQLTMPVTMINQSGLIRANYDSMDGPIRNWEIPVFIVRDIYGNWNEVMREMGLLREDFINYFDSEDRRSLGITDHYVSLDEIRDNNPSEPIIAYADPYVTRPMEEEAIPMLLELGLILIVQERRNIC